jgi:hypothetical protein
MTALKNTYYGDHRFPNGLIIDADHNIQADATNGLNFTDPINGEVGMPALINDRIQGKVQEQIIMAVDYSTGISPATNMKVFTQADYDALGYPVKYWQDAIDLIPSDANYKVTINVANGLHYARPGTTGGNPALKAALILPQFKHSESQDMMNASINFVAAMADVETGIAVTVSAEGVTRTSGAWSEDELLDQFIIITSGASSGADAIPVWKNSTSMAYLAKKFTALGAAVVSVVKPGATFMPQWDDGTALNVGIYSRFIGLASIPIKFEGIAFGNADKPWNYWNALTGQSIWYTQCVAYGTQFIGTFESYSSASYSRIWMSSVVLHSIEGYSARSVFSMDGVSSVGGSGVVVLGSTSASALIMLGDYYSGSVLRISNLVVRPSASFSKVLVGLYCGALFYPASSSSPCKIQGNGICTGIKIGHYRGEQSYVSNLASMRIQDCAIAFDISGNTESLEALLPDSTGNTVGWKIEGGGRVVIKTPSQIAATTEMQIDGDSITYAALPAGTTFEGALGSSVIIT